MAEPQQQQQQQQHNSSDDDSADSGTSPDVTFKVQDDANLDATPPPVKRQTSSIYNVLSNKRRNAILFVAALATMIVPCTDTIYLPAMKALGEDLHAGTGLVAGSVAIYMLMVGLGSLLWGPAADKYGRRTMYIVGMVLYLGTSLACLFAPTIGVLVAFRGLQGLAVASFIVIGSGVLADIFPPHIRGTAQGMLSIPLLVGPIIGPLLGGVLSQNFGWRSTFICLVVFAGGIVAPLLILVVPETLQYHVVRQMSKRDLSVLDTMAEAATILEARPRLSGPWQPLFYLVERQIAPYAFLVMLTFGCMFASLTEWPAMVSQPPYSLNEGMVGVSYLAMGIAGFLASPIGGFLSDLTARKWSDVPVARLIPATISGTFISTTGLLIYAWTLAYQTSLAGPLVAHALIGAGCSSILPGVFGYISTVKQANASAAAAGVNCGMFMLAGVLILVGAYAVQAMGVGPFFTLLAGVQLLMSLTSAACITWGFVSVRRQQAAAEQLPVRA